MNLFFFLLSHNNGSFETLIEFPNMMLCLVASLNV